jgi:DNA polymerase III epsilon subunit-like protein/CRISPR/Cas system-associated exonuclease Cas4 (RecB family)
MTFDYVYIDTETTGLNPAKDEIVEVAAIEFNMSGAIGETLKFLCKPNMGFIPDEATKIHGIKWDDVKNEKNYFEIRPDIAKFINKRTLVGHNINDFDIKFLKLRPLKIEDTLVMCRRTNRTGNKLKTACQKNGIDWDDSLSHRAEYDVRKGIELYIKLKNKEEPRESNSLFNPILPPTSPSDLKKLGVVPSERDKELLATQSYSFSRINLYHQCPFKWYWKYIKKLDEPEVEYFLIGKICHRIAEVSGEWCFRQLFINKFESFANLNNLQFSKDELMVDGKFSGDITYKDVGAFLYDNTDKILKYTGQTGLAALIYCIDHAISPDSYERPSMPDRDEYEKMIQSSINQYKCTDGYVINEVRYIMNRFYNKQSFATLPGEIILTERRLAFDKDWKILKDFYNQAAFFRGVIDVISWMQDCVVILDYKTSRKMMSDAELKNDMQLKTYVLLLLKYLPENSVNKIVIMVNYIRFGITIEYEITDPKSVADEATQWINASIQQIESELLKTDGSAFNPKRNKYCHTCFLAEDGKCPLFNKFMITQIDDIENFIVRNEGDCRAAFKRIEANKAENSRLTKLCKAFIEEYEGTVTIDDTATLDFYSTRSRKYDTVKTMKWLLSKGKSIEQVLKFFSITPSSFNALLEKSEMEINEDALNEISVEKIETTFDAYTEDERLDKGVIND